MMNIRYYTVYIVITLKCTCTCTCICNGHLTDIESLPQATCLGYFLSSKFIILYMYHSYFLPLLLLFLFLLLFLLLLTSLLSSQFLATLHVLTCTYIKYLYLHVLTCTCTYIMYLHVLIRTCN